MTRRPRRGSNNLAESAYRRTAATSASGSPATAGSASPCRSPATGRSRPRVGAASRGRGAAGLLRRSREAAKAGGVRSSLAESSDCQTISRFGRSDQSFRVKSRALDRHPARDIRRGRIDVVQALATGSTCIARSSRRGRNGGERRGPGEPAALRLDRRFNPRGRAARRRPASGVSAKANRAPRVP